MGSAECLVVIDVRQDSDSKLRAVTDIYRPLADETIWFSWEDDPSPGEIVVGPHVDAGAEGGQPEGRFWVRLADNITKTAEVVVQSEQRTRSLSSDGGKYTWNQVDRPMVLMILPRRRRLNYVDPKPMCDGVWERNERLCLFWPAPAQQTSYAFALGKQTSSLRGNAKRWRRRTRNFRPTSRRQVLIVSALGLLFCLLVAGAIALGGQEVAGVWVATVAAVASLFLTVVGLVTVRQPTTGAQSYPA
jgi:hypothetical protein